VMVPVLQYFGSGILRPSLTTVMDHAAVLRYSWTYYGVE
jgi:hypothetical protein